MVVSKQRITSAPRYITETRNGIKESLFNFFWNFHSTFAATAQTSLLPSLAKEYEVPGLFVCSVGTSMSVGHVSKYVSLPARQSVSMTSAVPAVVTSALRT